jgi:hypothetical protein
VKGKPDGWIHTARNAANGGAAKSRGEEQIDWTAPPTRQVDWIAQAEAREIEKGIRQAPARDQGLDDLHPR